MKKVILLFIACANIFAASFNVDKQSSRISFELGNKISGEFLDYNAMIDYENNAFRVFNLSIKPNIDYATFMMVKYDKLDGENALMHGILSINNVSKKSTFKVKSVNDLSFILENEIDLNEFNIKADEALHLKAFFNIRK